MKGTYRGIEIEIVKIEDESATISYSGNDRAFIKTEDLAVIENKNTTAGNSKKKKTTAAKNEKPEATTNINPDLQPDPNPNS